MAWHDVLVDDDDALRKWDGSEIIGHSSKNNPPERRRIARIRWEQECGHFIVGFEDGKVVRFSCYEWAVAVVNNGNRIVLVRTLGGQISGEYPDPEIKFFEIVAVE